jgi:hypothetical protein
LFFPWWPVVDKLGVFELGDFYPQVINKSLMALPGDYAKTVHRGFGNKLWITFHHPQNTHTGTLK